VVPFFGTWVDMLLLLMEPDWGIVQNDDDDDGRMWGLSAVGCTKP
jgi:hypothetical protein